MGFTPGFGGELEQGQPGLEEGSVPLGREPRTGSPRRCSRQCTHARLGHVQSEIPAGLAGYRVTGHPRALALRVLAEWTWPNRAPGPKPGGRVAPGVGLGRNRRCRVRLGAGGSKTERTDTSPRSGSPPLVPLAQTGLDPGPGHPLLPWATGLRSGSSPSAALAPGSGPGHPLHAGSGSPPACPLRALVFVPLPLPFPLPLLPPLSLSPPPPSFFAAASRPERFFWALGHLGISNGLSKSYRWAVEGVRKCRWRRAQKAAGAGPRGPGQSPQSCDLAQKARRPGSGRTPGSAALVEIGPDPSGPGRPPVRDLVAWPPRSGPGRPQCGTGRLARPQARVAPPLSGPGRPRARDSVKSGLGEMSRGGEGGPQVVAGRSGEPGPRSGVDHRQGRVDPPSQGRRR